MAIRIVVDRLLCDSQALCTQIAPAVFEMDDEDVMQVRVESPEGELLERARLAAGSCPKGAISLVDD